MVTETEIEYYELEHDKSPFTEWLENLRDAKTINRIRARIDTMETGNLGDCRPVTGAQGLFEARLDFGPGYRLYFVII